MTTTMTNILRHAALQYDFDLSESQLAAAATKTEALMDELTATQAPADARLLAAAQVLAAQVNRAEADPATASTADIQAALAARI